MTAEKRLEAELERRILYGLACEYDLALDLLEASLRSRLPRPLFAVRDLKSRWGQWSGALREIAVSRDLVLHYPWGAVREVLRHEMAHQLAEVLDEGPGAPHGAAFAQACRLLRADPAAAASYRALHGATPQEALSPEDRLRRKVQKLFALADSPNPHEAAGAMRKARELMARLGAPLEGDGSTTAYVSILLGAPALRHNRSDYLLAGLLMDLYAVVGVWVPAFVAEKKRMGRALEISGRPTRVQVATYAHDFVKRFIDRSWRTKAFCRGTGRRSRNDFAAGVIEGFQAKIASGPAERPAAAGRALVPAGDPAMEGYLRYRYPRLRRTCSRARRQDQLSYAAGLSEGRQLTIHPGVGDGQAQPEALCHRPALLPAPGR